MDAATTKTAPVRSSAEHARRLAVAGWWIVLGGLVPIGAWMALAPLTMAVVAPAMVKVDLNRRPVQHLEGGIVREVLVRDGQEVKAGDPVLVLGDVGVDAERNRLAYRASVERAGLARLEAEQARAPFPAYPRDLVQASRQDERIAEVLRKETALFRARSESLASEVGLMHAQRQRVGIEMSALRAQIAQLENALALHHKDLEANRGLLGSGFISTARFAQIEASVADYAAKLEERRSEVARAGQRLGDLDLRIRSVENAFSQSASDQLKVATARLAEIEQESRKSNDASLRQVVTAPASGQVIDLKFTSPGAVVKPGDLIAEIVPVEARLLIEAAIRPEEVAHVTVDQDARIRFTAFKYRNTSMVAGKVSYVSADRLIDRGTQQPYYGVTIVADAQSLREAGDFKVQAGMPAEVYIEGTKQTPLQYLLEPVLGVVRRAAKEI